MLSASVHMPRIGCGLAGGKWEEIEPIAADVRSRKDESQARTERRAVLRLVAALLGCAFDDLARRDEERRKWCEDCFADNNQQSANDRDPEPHARRFARYAWSTLRQRSDSKPEPDRSGSQPRDRFPGDERD